MEKKYNELPWSAQSPNLNPVKNIWTFELTMTFVTLRKMESHRPLTSKQDQTVRIIATGVGHCVKRTVNTFWKAYLVRHHCPWHQEGFKWIKHAWWVYITLLMKKRKFKIMFNLAKMLQNRVLAPMWSKWHKTGFWPQRGPNGIKQAFWPPFSKKISTPPKSALDFTLSSNLKDKECHFQLIALI